MDHLLPFLFLFYHKGIRESVSSPYTYISTLGIYKAVVPVTKFSAQTLCCPDVPQITAVEQHLYK